MFKNNLLLLPAACIAMLGGVAHAQNFTFYGNLDVGVANTNISGSTNANNNKNISEVITGGLSPTFLGIKGEKSMEGLTGGFMLEQGVNFAPDENAGGTSTSFGPSATTNQLYNRKANLYLSGSAGTVRLGTQPNAAWAAVLRSDPRAGSNYGGAVPAALGYKMTTFDTNVLSYASPAMNGFSGEIGYRFANDSGDAATGTGQNGSAGSGSGVRLLLAYSAGNFATNLGYYSNSNTQKATAATQAEQYSGSVLGGSYKFGAFTLKGIYLNQKVYGNLATQGGFATYGIGGNYAINDKTLWDFGYYKTKDDGTQNNTDFSQTATGVTYELIPGLKAYGQLAVINNTSSTANAPFFAVAGSAANSGSVLLGAGATATVINVGLKYNF